VNSAAFPRLAVVIPAYNEASTIADIARRAGDYSDRVIVVNDGSSDETARVLEKLPVTLLNNTQNLGKGKSLLCGARLALEQGATAVITLDGDGQHRPEDIPLLLEMAAANPDTIIIAARLHNRNCAPPLRRFANSFADFWISWAAGYRICDSQSGFRLYPAATFQQCPTESDNFVFESEILIDAARQGMYSKGVAIGSVYHQNSRNSHYRPASDTWAIIRMVAGKLLNRGLYPLGLLRALGIWSHPQTRQSSI
jgi:glycosyltransferase involved in cell wall biosynthesis